MVDPEGKEMSQETPTLLCLYFVGVSGHFLPSGTYSLGVDDDVAPNLGIQTLTSRTLTSDSTVMAVVGLESEGSVRHDVSVW